MYACDNIIDACHEIRFPEFKSFEIEDYSCFEAYINQFQPISCEYNFANLFSWQKSCKLSWSFYQDRILIYDNESQNCFMPLGKEFLPQELVFLSLQLQYAGLRPVFSLCPTEYLKKYPELVQYFDVESRRDIAEYVYNVNALSALTGVKLHKKRNLIAQFKRLYPKYEVHALEGEYRSKAFGLSQKLLKSYKKPPRSLKNEFSALQETFEHFNDLKLEGLAIVVDNQVIAFSIFSRLNSDTYDIQYEKSDNQYKGAGQIINQETAIFLEDKCRYVNREQDLGIKGLRQAKLSYEPEKLIEFHALTYKPSS